MQDIFYMPTESYNTPLNPTKSYLIQLSFYIQTKLKCSKAEANQKAVLFLKSKFKDREMKCFERLENGDRVAKTTTLHSYIRSNLDEQNILAPTFTSYLPRSKKVSVLSDFIFVSVQKRGIAKKEAHKAKADGNMVLFDNKNNEQNNLKTYCNSMSGSFAQEACILHNPSNHSTLTSITRTMTSLSNANNERLISGNRYFPRAIDVLNHVIYVSSNADLDTIGKAVQYYGIKVPSVEETVVALRRSSDLYFRDRNYYEKRIVPFLSNLDPLCLAAICYTGDLYHLRKFNPELLRELLDKLSTPVTVTTRDPDIVNKAYSIDENILNLSHHVFFTRMKGKGKTYDKLTDSGIVDDIYATSLGIVDTLKEFKLFFNAFFMTPIMPPNSFRLKNMRRRTVVLSDTDSTCFTTDEWITWYNGGKFSISDKTIAVASAVAFVTTQSIINLVRNLSRNLNIDPSLIGRLGMKNEFLWLTHSPAEVSKHYYAYTVSQEMAILGEPEVEIKGVHLKNSAVPKFVIEDAAKMMEDVLVKTSQNGSSSLTEILQHVVKLENLIRDSVIKGEPLFLKRSKIKEASAYGKGPDESPYGRHVFWNSVFGPTYGEFAPPPYGVIKIPTTITTKTKLTEWVNSIDNPDIKTKLEGWLLEKNKKNLPTVYMNDEWVSAYAIPKEILQIIDVHRIILDVTIQHRIVLETLGVLLYPDRLVSEQFSL